MAPRRLPALLALLALAGGACSLTVGGRSEPPPDAPLVLVAPPAQSDPTLPPRDLQLAMAGIENAIRLRGLRSLPLAAGYGVWRRTVGTLPYDPVTMPGTLVQLGHATGADAVLFVLVTELHTEEGVLDYDLTWQVVSTIDERTLFDARRRGSWRREVPTVDPTHRAQDELEPVMFGGDDAPQDPFEAIEALHRGVLATVPEVPKLRQP